MAGAGGRQTRGWVGRRSRGSSWAPRGVRAGGGGVRGGGAGPLAGEGAWEEVWHRGPAPPPRPATCLPPAARARGFAFRPRRRRQRSAERRREGATVRDGRARPRSAAAARTMAPAALWAALAVGLQLWGAGHSVPVQVGDSRGSHAHRLARTPHPGAPRPRSPPGRVARGDPGAAVRGRDGRGARAWTPAGAPPAPRGRRGTRALGHELWYPRRSPAPPAQARVFGGWPASPGLTRLESGFQLRRTPSPCLPRRGGGGSVLGLCPRCGRGHPLQTSSSSGLWFSSFLEIPGLHA